MTYVYYICSQILKIMKKRMIITAAFLFVFAVFFAQNSQPPFKGRYENKEYKVYLMLDLKGQSVKVPGQDIYGELPGYLGKVNNPFCWLITGAKVKSESKATVKMINEYGSEDFTATLTLQGDSLLTLKKVEGSDIKMPNNGKWQKLPNTLVFKRK